MHGRHDDDLSERMTPHHHGSKEYPYIISIKVPIGSNGINISMKLPNNNMNNGKK
jgi:hypothetical protein